MSLLEVYAICRARQNELSRNLPREAPKRWHTAEPFQYLCTRTHFGVQMIRSTKSESMSSQTMLVTAAISAPASLFLWYQSRSSIPQLLPARREQSELGAVLTHARMFAYQSEAPMEAINLWAKGDGKI